MVINDLDQTYCRNVSYNFYCTLSDELVLAEEEIDVSNVCQGDSGGPLMYLKNDTWYVYGVLSYVTGTQNLTCLPIYPSFYVPVPAYQKWYTDEIQKLNSAALIYSKYAIILNIILLNILIKFLID